MAGLALGRRWRERPGGVAAVTMPQVRAHRHILPSDWGMEDGGVWL